MYLNKFAKILQPSALNTRAFFLISVLGFVYFVVTGSLSEWAIAGGVYFVKTILGTVYLHRYITHKSFKVGKWFEYVGAASMLIGAGHSPITWAAFHRAHHANSDRKGDPHSPVLQGFWQVQFGLIPIKPNIALVPDLTKSALHMHVHRYLWSYNIAFVIILFLIDPMAVLYAHLVPNLIANNISRSINSLNHLWGYRNYPTKDNSRNHWFTGIFGAGEGWHNNHHAQPANPQFGHKWWEVDFGWYLIKLIRTDNVDIKR